MKRNVIDKFICRNYREDDNEIFGFGFNQGDCWNSSGGFKSP
nr:DUF2235 domain-containing protein [Bradyrhizobium sp. BRP56]